MNKHEVVIAGGGPTGLMLAAELALAGIDVAIVERRPNQELNGSRAGGLHARSIEVLDQRGVAGRFLAEGKTSPNVGFGWFPLDISDFPTRHNYLLALWQSHIERLLAGWAEELNVHWYREREVVDFTEDSAGVDVQLADGSSLRAAYLVGCDGGRSVVRKAAGIEFAGWDATISHLIAEVQMTEEPEWGLRRDAHGAHGLSKLEDESAVRVMITEREVGRPGEPTLDDLRAGLLAVYGKDFGVHSPRWVSRFTDMARQAVAYRKGRVLLAGDAAHVHYPAGGQGLNTGLQDAVNLGWKLAQVVRNVAPDSLLDTYHAERHPVGAEVLRNTLAQVALLRTDDRTNALRETMSTLLKMDQPRRHIAATISGLAVHYDLGEGHPMLGRRMPDLELETGTGSVRVFSLLHRGQPALINLGQPGSVSAGPWSDRVRVIDAQYGGPWELPAIGTVAPPAAVLVRPDGHVAWVGDKGAAGTGAGLDDALARWFGPPSILMAPALRR